MSRDLLDAELAEIYAQQTRSEWVDLLTVTHADLATPLRLVNADAQLTSRGDVFEPFPYEVRWPDDREDRPAGAQIRVDAVDRSVILALRPITTPLAVKLEVVRVSSPDAVVVGPLDLEMRAAPYDGQALTATVTPEPILDEPWPFRTFIPSLFPGLFR